MVGWAKPINGAGDMSRMADRRVILIADDNEQNLELLKVYLMESSEGAAIPTVEGSYEILSARDGPEALDLFERHSPDIVLLDVMIPKLDGFEVCKKIKSTTSRRHVPVLIVTALDELKDLQKAFDAGADDFLSKPVNKVELRSRVRSMLRVKVLFDEQTHNMTKLATSIEELQASLTRFQNQQTMALREPGVFISYSKEDLWTVELLTDSLERDGINFWLDDKELHAGESIDTTITEAIRDAWLFLVLLTPKSLASNWVMRELEQALHQESEGRTMVIPVMAGGVTERDMPTRLHHKKCVNLDTGFPDSYKIIRESILIQYRRRKGF